MSMSKGKRLGWWHWIPVAGQTCHKCKGPAMLVPREGHELSEFWRFEGRGSAKGDKLFCCAGECVE